MHRLPWKLFVALAVAMFLAGSNVVVGKWLLAYLPTNLASALRFGIATLTLLPFLLRQSSVHRGGGGQGGASRDSGVDGWRRRVPWLGIGGVFLQSLFGNLLFNLCLLTGLRWSSAADAGVIISVTPALVAIISVLFLGERLRGLQVAGILLSVAGVVLLHLAGTTAAVGGGHRLLGSLLLLGAALGESLWTVIGKATSKRMAPLAIATWAAGFGCLMFLPLALMEVRTAGLVHLPIAVWAGILWYGMAGTAGSYLLWYLALAQVPASTAGIFAGLMPVSTILLSVVALHERLTVLEVGGGVLVLLAVWLFARQRPEARPRHETEQRPREGSAVVGETAVQGVAAPGALR